MAPDVETRKIGDVAQVNPDSYSLSEDWEYVNYLDTSNITDGHIDTVQKISRNEKLPSRARRKVRPGDMIYSTVRPNQRHFGLLSGPLENMLVSTGFAVIRGQEGVADTRYLYYYLSQEHIIEQLQVIAEHNTSAYPALRPGDIANLEIDLPSWSEQQAIASTLAALDDKIELNQRMNETLEAMARALFRAWFVDFEPVKAKAAGATHFPGLPQPAFDTLPTNFTDSPLGPIPEGWAVKPLSEIADSPRRSINPSEVPAHTAYIGLEHMPRRSISLSEWENASKITSAKTRFEKGDLLFGKLRPYFHKVGIAPLDGICSTDIVIVTPRECDLGPFVLACISSDEFVAYTNAASTGTKMPRTSWKTMKQYEVCLPPRPLIDSFNALANPMIERITANIHESRTLAQMRDLLLPRLMSGEIRVDAAEDEIAETTG